MEITDQKLEDSDIFKDVEENINNELIDYVLVYKADSDHLDRIENYLHNLVINGLILRYQEIGELIFVLVEIPFNKCLEVAEKIKLRLPIEDMPNKIELDSNVNVIYDDLTFSETPRNKFTAPYNSKIHFKFEKYFNKENPEETFSSRDRILLVYEILSRTQYSKRFDEASIFSKKNNDKDFGIERLLANETFVEAYPLHQKYLSLNTTLTKRRFLLDHWVKPKYWITFQPIFVIRDYFGEKIAFYFAWLGYYTSWLIIPSFLGIIVFLYGLLTFDSDIPTNQICDYKKLGNITMCPLCENEFLCPRLKLGDSCFYSKISYFVDNPMTILFSIFMSIWTVLFFEFWKRKQYYFQFEWEVVDFEKKYENMRPEFEISIKHTRVNPITKEIELYVPLKSKIWRYLVSFSVVLLMICLVLALVFGFVAYKLSLILAFPKDTDPNVVYLTTSISGAIINLVIIIVLSKFYYWLAVKLNDLELHRTESNYERALTLKVFLFEFVNYYASIFYIAFLKGKFKDSKIIEQCDQSGCLSELCIQLAIIMVGRQIFTNIQEIIFPLVTNYFSRMTESHKKRVDKNASLYDYYLMSCSNFDLFYEYLEMVIQYGFVTLFAVAFPLGPFFALINNIVEIRIDAFKLLTQQKRPLPKKSQNIGIWLTILNYISKLAVITNGLILAFTSDFIPRLVFRMFFQNENIKSLDGYVNFTLTKDYFDLNGTKIECYYKNFREPNDTSNSFESSRIYYYILIARLAFLIIFEHLVFSIVAIMHWIPDIPTDIQNKINAENLVIQGALWEASPEKSL